MAKKDSYAVYKTENRAYTNKVKKLERHCKNFPNDKVGKENLERLRDPKNFKHRNKPNNPGSNPTTPKIKLYQGMGHVFGPRTAGEQLSELLGIPMPKFQRRAKKGKTPITIKKKKDVKRT